MLGRLPDWIRSEDPVGKIYCWRIRSDPQSAFFLIPFSELPFRFRQINNGGQAEVGEVKRNCFVFVMNCMSACPFRALLAFSGGASRTLCDSLACTPRLSLFHSSLSHSFLLLFFFVLRHTDCWDYSVFLSLSSLLSLTRVWGLPPPVCVYDVWTIFVCVLWNFQSRIRLHAFHSLLLQA